MATVDALELPGLSLWFWSDDHEPPHFHAKRRGEWEVKVHFMRESEEMIEMKWADRRPTRGVLKELARLAEEHRIELLEQWEQVHGD